MLKIAKPTTRSPRTYLRTRAIGIRRLAALACAATFSSGAHATPLDDLSGGQTGRIEFNSKTPDHRWALIRGRLGADTPIFGDLLMPANALGKVPAVVLEVVPVF